MPRAKLDDSSDDTARREAQRLIRAMRRDLRAIATYLDAEEEHLGRRAPSAKRVARLRLIAQDLSSGRGFTHRDEKR